MVVADSGRLTQTEKSRRLEVQKRRGCQQGRACAGPCWPLSRPHGPKIVVLQLPLPAVVLVATGQSKDELRAQEVGLKRKHVGRDTLKRARWAPITSVGRPFTDKYLSNSPEKLVLSRRTGLSTDTKLNAQRKFGATPTEVSITFKTVLARLFTVATFANFSIVAREKCTPHHIHQAILKKRKNELTSAVEASFSRAEALLFSCNITNTPSMSAALAIASWSSCIADQGSTAVLAGVNIILQSRNYMDKVQFGRKTATYIHTHEPPMSAGLPLHPSSKLLMHTFTNRRCRRRIDAQPMARLRTRPLGYENYWL